MITAAETCDFINEVVCKPANVKELFEFGNFAGTQISRTEVLILLAAIIPVVVVFFGLRKKSVVPGKLQSAVESIFTFVKDEIALGVIGRGGSCASTMRSNALVDIFSTEGFYIFNFIRVRDCQNEFEWVDWKI